jgi:hypothetical protein
VNKKDGQAMARVKGICLHIGGGRVAGTCGRPLRRGKCPTHGSDIYTPLGG